MKRFAGLAILLAAFAPAAGSGPLGAIITVSTKAYDNTSLDLPPAGVAYNADTGRYLSVSYYAYQIINGFDYRIVTSLINADDGATTAPVSLDFLPGIACFTPAVAWNPSNGRFLLVFSVGGGGIIQRVKGAVLDGDGAPQGDPFYISGPVDQTYEFSISPQVACDGKDWLVAWKYVGTDSDPGQGSRIEARRVGGNSAAGAPMLGPVLAIEDSPESNGTRSQPSVAFGGAGEYLVAWAEDSQLFARTVANDNTMGARVRIDNGPTSTSDLVRPSVAGNLRYGRFLVAWAAQDPVNGDGDVYARQLGAGGQPIGGPAEVIPDAANASSVLMRSVTATWNAGTDQYFIAWEETAGVFGARMDDRGLELNEPPFPLGDAAWGTTMACASRAGTNQVLAQWQSSPGFATVLARRADLGLNPHFEAPVAPVLGQVDPATGIAVDADVPMQENRIRLRVHHGEINVPAGRIEFELRPSGTAFSNLATDADASPSASDGAITLSGLPWGSAYHWQARVISPWGWAGPWTAFSAHASDFSVVANALPEGASAGQFLAADGATIVPGIRIDASRIRLEADGSDITNDRVRIDVEVRALGTAFVGAPTATSSFTPSGGRPGIEVTLAGGASYHWQWRITDEKLGSSAWTSYGGNAETEADFTILAEGSTGPLSCLSSAHGAGLALTALLACSMLLRRL